MIQYSIIPYNNTQRVVYSLLVSEPYEKLSVVGNLFEDIDDFIEWLEELIARQISDYSELGAILYQGVLWGSVRSKIVDLLDNEKYIEKQEFYTRDLLQLCKEWRTFLEKKDN